MRTRLLAVLAIAIAMAAALIPSSSGALTLKVKLGEAVIGVNANPAAASGTVTFSLNTISAKCSSSSLTGTAFVKPQCTTRTITCPATASSCDLQLAPVRQTAFAGTPEWAGFAYMSGGYSGVNNPEPYHCNAATNVCQQQITFTGLPAASTASVNVYNVASGLGLPSIGVQATLVIH